MSEQANRFHAMGLTGEELEGFVDFMCGFDLAAVKSALDMIESDRKYRAEREANR